MRKRFKMFPGFRWRRSQWLPGGYSMARFWLLWVLSIFMMRTRFCVSIFILFLLDYTDIFKSQVFLFNLEFILIIARRWVEYVYLTGTYVIVASHYFYRAVRESCESHSSGSIHAFSSCKARVNSKKSLVLKAKLVTVKMFLGAVCKDNYIYNTLYQS